MRSILALALILTFALGLAACGSNAVDDAWIPGGPDLAAPGDCPTGFQSPAYCFAGPQGTGSSCGACASTGELCNYFEATLVCAGDHQWRCYWAGGSSRGCPHGDGGI